MASSPSAPPALMVLLVLGFALHGVVVKGRGRAWPTNKAQVRSSTTALLNDTVVIFPVTGLDDQNIGLRAWASTPFESTNYGAKAKLSVHDLPDVATNQRSFALIQVMNGQSGLNVIQAGWMVSPDLFGDTRTRLFTYWMAGGHGCYNVQCNGFVVRSGSPITPGSVLAPGYTGIPNSITLTIFKDGPSGDWYLWYEDETQDTQVGYWPKSLFTGLAEKGTGVGYGGIVCSAPASIVNRNPPMGNGHHGSEGEGRAASFKKLQLFGEDNRATDCDDLATRADAPWCYDIKLFPKNGDGVHFYYGGPSGC